ncbi:AraC family transcriptional regulator [Salinisphaera sp. T5B8]|uniref:DJ-1/PfpI family protein n=1 Tax=Salinisphaera sp. T5B8 TaxID=1304154 RepID=UPI00333F2299
MRFGFLIFDGVEELDLLGPWELVGVWAEYFDGPGERLLVAAQPGPVRCAKGLTLTADVGFADCPALDVLLVPGGRGTRRVVDEAETIAFISECASQCQALLSVCTGAFLLHRAGVLTGQPATTHWASLDRLRALGDVAVQETRFTHAGHIWTSAGVSAGMDMTLAFIADIAGERTAGEVQRWAEYYPDDRRYGDAHRADELPAYIKDFEDGE